MSKIKVTDQNDTTKLTAEQMTQVKGGAGYIKIGDIKGESKAVSGSIRTSVQWPYRG